MADLKDLIELKTSLDAEEVRELHRLRAQNTILLEALKQVWRDCEIAAITGSPDSYDAIQQETFKMLREAIAEAETQSPTNATT